MADVKRYRLRPDLMDDLAWYWCTLDSELGVCSNMGSQQARLLRLSPSEADTKQARLEFFDRWRLGGAYERQLLRAEKWRRADDEIRRFWYTMAVHDDPGSHLGEPDGNPRVRARACRIHSTLGRLVKSQKGSIHVTVLYAVYGDPSLCLVKDELGRLARLLIKDRTPEALAAALLPKRRIEAEELLSNASRAYTECHVTEMKDRLEVRLAEFRGLLGAA